MPMTPSNEERVERLLELATTVRTLRGYL